MESNERGTTAVPATVLVHGVTALWHRSISWRKRKAKRDVFHPDRLKHRTKQRQVYTFCFGPITCPRLPSMFPFITVPSAEVSSLMFEILWSPLMSVDYYALLTDRPLNTPRPPVHPLDSFLRFCRISGPGFPQAMSQQGWSISPATAWISGNGLDLLPDERHVRGLWQIQKCIPAPRIRECVVTVYVLLISRGGLEPCDETICLSPLDKLYITSLLVRRVGRRTRVIGGCGLDEGEGAERPVVFEFLRVGAYRAAGMDASCLCYPEAPTSVSRLRTFRLACVRKRRRRLLPLIADRKDTALRDLCPRSWV